MATEFRLPDLGEGVQEGQVLRLMVAEGDLVVEDQVLMEVETDKAAVEIPSPATGSIDKLHVAENQIVNVGDVMVTFGGEGGTARKDTGAAARTNSEASGHAETRTGTASAGAHAKVSDSVPPRKPASPAVRKLARRLGVDLAVVSGSGPGGRVLHADVECAAEAGPSAAPTAAVPSSTPPIATAPVTPAPTPTSPVATPTVIPGDEGRDEFGPVRTAPIHLTRKRIAEVMSEAARTIPHVTDCDDADVTSLNTLRRGYNETATPETKLGMLPFVVRAVARALQRHPIFNASFDASGAGTIVYKRYFHVAIGVQTERGLVAPVLRDVDRKGVVEIGADLARLTATARAGKLAPQDLQGATYTISNAGAMGGSRYSTPMITPPQVAVLALGRSRPLPWVVGDEILPRLIMPLSHSMDHRIIDGALEIAFMRDIIGDLENPGRLLL